MFKIVSNQGMILEQNNIERLEDHLQLLMKNVQAV